MKSKLYLSLFMAAALIMVYSHIQTRSTGAPAGRSGDPSAALTCQNGCHNTNALNAGAAEVSITSNIPEEGYSPDSTYTITAQIMEQGFPRFGFQAIAFGTNANTGVGAVTLTDGGRTRIMSAGDNQYVTHTSGGIDSSNSNTWTYDWTAPSAGEGEVILYAAFVAADGNGSNQSDFVYSTSDTLVEATAVPLLENIVSQLNIYAVPGQEEIRIEMDSPQTLELGIHIRDIQGREVYRTRENVLAGDYSKPIRADWETGIYVVSLQSSLGEQHQKILLR